MAGQQAGEGVADGHLRQSKCDRISDLHVSQPRTTPTRVFDLEADPLEPSCSEFLVDCGGNQAGRILHQEKSRSNEHEHQCRHDPDPVGGLRF